MKIDNHLRTVYNQYHPRFELLSDETTGFLKPRIEKCGWMFRSRIKELQSFALKVETGEVRDPSKMEDFFACTVIVPTFAQISEAEDFISGFFVLHERRPENKDTTCKQSSEFIFDDLRLYVTWPTSTRNAPSGLDGVVFEIQIKTTLQHAWSVATHDLIYKTDDVSWPRERIAFQVKAMLEHAEVAIAKAAQLEEAAVIAKQDDRTADIKNLIVEINGIWPREQLPRDVKRLAETLHGVLRIADCNVANFCNVINIEKDRIGIKTLPIDLSPYAFTVQALSHFAGRKFETNFKRKYTKTRIVTYDSMKLPAWMTKRHRRIIVIK